MMPLQPASPCPKPVAIVGIATELPSGHHSDRNFDHRSFFEFLLNKGESYEPIPRGRFNIDSWHGKGLGQVNTSLGSFLKDIDMFDPTEFGITMKDASSMAVGTRKLLELSFLALLDSGIDYRGRNVGCYMSAVAFDILSVAEPNEFEAKGSFSGVPSMVANRVSYHLDLTGPSIPMDTACSSTLIATHLAVQALRSGDCESAIVGGCQVNHRLVDFVQYSQGSLLAPDGKCKPFDASANGFSRGEGAGVVVLKLLEDAIRDGDHIYASILGTGINATGSSAPVHAPLADAQADAMRRAYRGTGRHPSEVDFVELHATGTAAGDPTEANWVGANFQREDELLLGSVKGNIGHLEIAAFIASLSKVCCMFETGLIPPNVNLNSPNPAIRWDEYKLRVPRETEDLRARAPSRRPLISLCSSGIGGANGHAVVEGPPNWPPTITMNGNGNGNSHADEAGSSSSSFKERVPRPTLFVTGGLTPRSAKENAEMLAIMAEIQEEEAPELSVACGRRARQVTWRSWAVKIPDDEEGMVFTQPILGPRQKPPVVFVFTGQGPQHLNMGRQLFKHYRAFRESILECDEIAKPLWGYSFIEKTGLFEDVRDAEVLPDIWPCTITLPSLVMVQIALVDLLASAGVKPDAIIGHSAGEVSMLYASGAASKAMVMEMVVARAKAMSVVEKVGGTMAALSCDHVEAGYILKEVTKGDATNKVELACYNTHDAVAIAGLETYVDKAVELAQTRGYFARKIKTRLPVHSSLMDICEDTYRQSMADLFERHPGNHTPIVTTYSTSTGTIQTDPFESDYFWKNTRQPVLFTQTMTDLLNKYPDAAIMEISPHPALSSYISSLGAAPTNITCPMKRSRKYARYDEEKTFLESIGRLIALGYRHVDFVSLNGLRAAPERHLEPLEYPFARKHVPYLPEGSPVVRRQMMDRNGPLNYPELRINSLTHPDLAEHVVKGEPIMPAAGYIEMAMEFGARVLWDIKFHSMMSLSSDKPLNVDVVEDKTYWSVKSHAQSAASDYGYMASSSNAKAPRLHADGFMSKEVPTGDFMPLDLPTIQSRCAPFNLDGFYKKLEAFATYGPVFRRVTECYRGRDEALVKVRGADVDLPNASKYVIHPAIIDACFHVMVHPAFTANTDPNVYYLPSTVALVLVHNALAAKRITKDIYCHAIFREWRPDQMIVDFIIANDTGERLVTMEKFGVAMHEHSLLPSVSQRFDLIYQPYFVQARSVPQKKANMVNGNGNVNEEIHLNGNGVHHNGVLPGSVEDAVSDCIKVFGKALEHLVITCGKKVIRILEIGAGNFSLTGKLSEVKSAYDQVHISHFVGDKSIRAAQDACRAANGSPGQAILFDIMDATTHDLTPSSFDVIIGFEALSSVHSLSHSFDILNRFLVPGGTLILGESNESLKSSMEVPVVVWNKQSINGTASPIPSDCSDSACIMEWNHLLEEAGYDNIAINDIGTQDVVFVTIDAQKHIVTLPPPTVVCVPDHIILPYAIGNEMSLREKIAALNEPTTIWITSTEGIQGDAALGMTRSLRQELFSWRIFTVVFHDSWSEKQQRSIIDELACIESDEFELIVDESGKVLIPRIVPVQSLTPTKSLEDNAFWIAEDRGIRQVNPSAVPPEHILVQIKSLSPLVEGLSGIVGIVVDAGDSEVPKGVRIITIAPASNSNFVFVHEDSIMALDEEPTSDLASSIVAFVTAALALKVKDFSQLRRLKSSRVLVNHDNKEVGSTIMQFYESLGVCPVPFGMKGEEAAMELIALQLEHRDIVVSCSRSSLVDSFVSPRARLFTVSDVQRVLVEDPWRIGDALRLVVPKMTTIDSRCSGSRSPEELYASSSKALIGTQLFKSDMSYLLLGGIGSLGLHIALWMYQKGARHLVLTSRSGVESLHRVQNVLALRMLAYLQSLPDLHIRLEASDASCKEASKELVESISPPLAGSMLVTGVISDGLFLSQTDESFRKVFAAKTEAFQAFESACPIESLDFFVAFSSFSSVGNAGQTNYSSANAAVTGLTRKYRNAFSILAPIITDSSSASDDPATESHLQHLLKWGLSARELCNYLEDGILKLADRPISAYIPDLKWDLVQKHIGKSNLFDHLVKEADTFSLEASSGDPITMLQDIILKCLDVPAEEFSPDVPFTSYGLDSLTAARMSHSLQPFVPITQLQLLADLNLKDLERRYQDHQRKRAAQTVVVS